MKTSFSLNDGRWDHPWPNRISRNDLVYLSPPLDPMQGLPLGNGDLGALVWCEGQQIHIAVNKCDLWDDADGIDPGELDRHAPWHTEAITVLRHACRVTIDLGMPLLDPWYLKDFEARIDLARGAVTIHGATPFGNLTARLFASADARALVVQLALDAQEAWSPTVTLSRWGCRSFWCWYNQWIRDPGIGLAGTQTRVAGDDAILTQRLSRLQFAVAASLRDADRAVAPQALHSRAAAWQVPPAETHALELMLTVADSEETEDAEAESRRLLSVARRRGLADLRARHEEEWERFWQPMHLRLGDACLEQLWHLTLYYAESSQRGRYPAPFSQALWGWNRDFQPWCIYHHWNQQILIWPVAAAGHPELMRPYLDYQHAALEGARQAARAEGRPGAHYSDVADRNGMMRPERNRTPGGQMVQYFWDYYRYTGDLDYLLEKGWPVMLEVARYYLAVLERGDDGLYHASPATCYEGHHLLRDCITELVVFRRVLEIALETARLREQAGRNGMSPEADAAEQASWRETLDHLAPLPTMESPVHPGVTIYAAGLQKAAGVVTGSSRPATEAEEWAGGRPTCGHDPNLARPIFSDVEISPVFPDGRVGLGCRGTPAFEVALNTVREANQHWLGLIAAARMGLRGEWPAAFARLTDSKRFAWSPTGFIHDGLDYWRTARVADARKAPSNWRGEPPNGPAWEPFQSSRIPTRMWEFRRIGQERPYLVATALNEALLQSHDGVIRVAAGAPLEWPFAFTLMAIGGFRVSAQGRGDRVDWIHILSLRGGECRVAKPWSGRAFLLDVAADEALPSEGGDTRFMTEPGGRYLLSPGPLKRSDWTCIAEHDTISGVPRDPAAGIALGLPRMF